MELLCILVTLQPLISRYEQRGVIPGLPLADLGKDAQALLAVGKEECFT